ncbi:MAG TPA: hypothetical protein VF868_09225 [Bacteroidia bacterium]|jgi:hypothetical protein
MAGILVARKLRNNAIYLLCAFSLLTAVFYNEHNLSKLPAGGVREGGTVITNDDASYYNPPKNFLRNGTWAEDYAGNVGHFIRPPGYGLLYLPLFYFFDEVNAITVLKCLQYLLFAISVYWFYSILMILTSNARWSLITSALYGLSPFATGFLSYTLTEGITPALILFYVYSLLKAYRSPAPGEKNRLYLFASLLFAFIFIVRPVLGIFGAVLLIFLVKDYHAHLKSMIARIVLFGMISISFMLIWQVRNYSITGKYVGLHPIYYEDNNTIYRAPFREYWSFAGCWAERGDKGFSYMVPMWDAAIQGDTSAVYVNAAIDNLPEHVVNHFGERRLGNVFRDYQAAVLHQKPVYDKGLPMPMEMSDAEKKVVDGFRGLTSEYKKEFPFQYYVLSPVKVYGLLAFHSNLSLYIFQRTYRGAWWMEALRFIFYSLHGLCFLFVFLNMIRIKRDLLPSVVLGWVPFLYIFYLCFVQRGVEERYTLPVLPLLMIGIIYAAVGLYRKYIIIKTSSG